MKKEQKNKKTNKELQDRSSFLIGFFVNYFKPSAFLPSISKIDLSMLKNQGIKLIICDLDNTLVPHYTKFPTQNIIKFVEEIKEKEFEFIIISNNTKKRVSSFSEKLNLSEFIWNAKKPFPFSIKKTINKLGVKPQETVVIGDMIITDILAANLSHTQSILIQPLIELNQTNNNRFSKWIENKIFKTLSNENLIVKETFEKNVYSEEYEFL